MKKSSPTPASLGYRMPAEWEPHEATWLTWPHAQSEMHWSGKLDVTPSIWARMVKALETSEDVHIAIKDDKTEKIAAAAMQSVRVVGKRVFFHRIPNNFSWARDHGPIFIKKGGKTGDVAMTHWKFNGWGKKWPFSLDRTVPTYVEKVTGVRRFEAPMVLEGGSIDVNGLGTLLTTEGCLLNSNRNPKLSKKDIEQNLRDYLGVTNILWLGKGIEGDDTDGHVDDLTRFVGPRTVVTMVEKNPHDVNFKPLQENYKRLKSMRDQDGNLLEVIPLAMPSPVVWDNIRLPASYANFYIGNKVVLLPIFSDPHDAEAIETLKEVFPTRKIVPIDTNDLVWGWGSFHCVTQQQPA